MANGFWRIGLDNTEKISSEIGTLYALKMPSIPKENFDSVFGTLTLPKPIIIDIGMWKDITGTDIEIMMPIMSIDVMGNHVLFPADSVLGTYTVVIVPMNDTNTEFGFYFETR